MSLPGNVSEDTVSLRVVASWNAADLSNASTLELKTLIRRIQGARFSSNILAKYQNVHLTLGPNNSHRINEIEQPNHRAEDIVLQTGNKNRAIQSELLRMAINFSNDPNARPNSIQWTQIGNGNNVTDWEFTNEAIKSLLQQHYNNKGNPFTVVKSDSRADIGQELWNHDIAIIHIPNQQGGSRHGFRCILSDHFGDFPSNRPNPVVSSGGANATILQTSGLLSQTSSEGAFFGAIWFLEENSIRDFLSIPHSCPVLFIPSHKRSVFGIRMELDGILLWMNNQVIYQAVFEVKKQNSADPEWSGGFSFHQVRDPCIGIMNRIQNQNPNLLQQTRIIPVYLRVEVVKATNTWVARFDRFDSFVNSQTRPQIVDSMDIRDLPM